MLRVRFEPATTALLVDKKHLDAELEDFKLFAMAKLNLGKGSVKHYVRRVKAFLVTKNSITDKDVQAYIQAKKEVCKPDYREQHN